MSFLARALDVFGRPKALVGKLFSHLRVDDAERAAVVEAASRGPVVFVLRSVSGIDALALYWLADAWKLPPIGFSHDLPSLPEAILAVPGSRGSGAGRTELEHALARGATSVVFLRRAPTVFSATGRPRAEGEDLMRTVLDHAAKPGRDVMLVPTTFFWSHRRETLGLSPFDAVFGPTDMPGDLRAVAQFLVNYQNGAVRFGEPVSARAFLHDEALGVGDAGSLATVRRLTFALLRKVERERRAALGPVRKAPDRVRAEVLRSARLSAMMDDLAQSDPERRAAIENKARRMLDGLAAEPNPDMLRALEPVADRLVQRVFAAVDVEPEGVERVREAARKGTVVLLPCHKSHVDYLVLSYVLRKNLLELPMVAAGDNLSFFPVGELLRRGGAFFIRRDFRGDRLYAAVVDAYVRRLMRDGWAIEFYLEGGRSRTGRLLEPKLGLLNLVVDAAIGLEGRPVSFVPVHIGYERTMEDFELAQEKAGGKKERESIRSLFAVVDALRYDYGRVAVTFGVPIDLEALRGQLGLEGALSPAKRRSLTTKIAGYVAHGIHKSARLSAGCLVAMALLDMPGRGLTHPELVARVGRLLTIGRRSGAEPVRGLVHGDGRVREAAVRDAAVMFVRGGLVKEHTPDATLARDGRVEVARSSDEIVYTVPEDSRHRLDFSKNGILHFYLERGLVSLAFRAAKARLVPRARVVEGALELARLLAHDLIELGDAVEPLASRLERTIDDMIGFGELAPHADALGVGPGNDEDDAMAWLASHGAHLTSVLESYRVATRTLQLILEASLPDRDLMKQALAVGHQMFLGGEIDRREAVSAPTFASAFEAFVGLGLLKRAKDRYEVTEKATLAEVRALEGFIVRHVVSPLAGRGST